MYIVNLLLLLQCVLAAPTGNQVAPALERRDGLPSYVKDYAPVLWLARDETFFPADLAQFLDHVTPTTENRSHPELARPVTLDSLDDLNLSNGTIFLSANSTITELPTWFYGQRPEFTGEVQNATSCAVVVVDKGSGIEDAFYFYFYAYNEGNHVDPFGDLDLGGFGDHLADWEHTMVRFHNGVPYAVWLSQHGFGQAFHYKTMEKEGLRPVAYVGRGTHANWPTPGNHDHFRHGYGVRTPILLTDHASRGVRYDPLRSAWFYNYDVETREFSAYDTDTPVNWLSFTGHWGDARFKTTFSSQKILWHHAKYTTGPKGPISKKLDRPKVCQQVWLHCSIRKKLTSFQDNFFCAVLVQCFRVWIRFFLYPIRWIIGFFNSAPIIAVIGALLPVSDT